MLFNVTPPDNVIQLGILCFVRNIMLVEISGKMLRRSVGMPSAMQDGPHNISNGT